MLSRGFLILSLVLAVATLVLAALMGQAPAPVIPMADGFRTPILALEFARSSNDVGFLAGDDAETLKAALREIQRLDRYFPLAYAGMAAALFAGLALRDNKLALLGLIAALATIPADWSENRAINSFLGIDAYSDALSQRPADDPEAVEWFENFSIHLEAMVVDIRESTWIKWGLIALYAAVFAAVLAMQGRRLLAIPSAVAALAILATWLSGSNGHVAELMGLTLIPFMLSFPVTAVMVLRSPDKP